MGMDLSSNMVEIAMERAVIEKLPSVSDTFLAQLHRTVNRQKSFFLNNDALTLLLYLNGDTLGAV